MLSTFHVIPIVYVPDLRMLGFGANMNFSRVVLQDDTPASHVATTLKAESLSVPSLYVAFVQDCVDVQLTSEAFHVTVDAGGIVNAAAFARIESRSCFVSVASTMLLIVTI